MATTLAVSTLPIGGRILRSGMIIGLVTISTACAIWLRKSARAELHDETQDQHVEIERQQGVDEVLECDHERGFLSGDSLAKCLGHLAAAIGGGLEGGGDDTTQVRGLECAHRGLGGAALGGDFRAQPRQVAVAVARHAARAEQRLDRELLRSWRAAGRVSTAASVMSSASRKK